MLESAKRRDRVGLRIDSSRAPVRQYRPSDGELQYVDYHAVIAFGDVVQQYDTGAEFRPGQEVCSPESVASWPGLPFVDEHPDDGVTVDNAATLGRGVVLKAWPEYPDVAAVIRVNDRRTIDRIDAGKQKLSCGYDLQFDAVSGVYNGKPYTRRQKNIRGDHVALTYAPRGERDGETPRLYMDSTGAPVGVQKDEDTMKKIKLPDGSEVEVPEAVAALIESLQAQLKPPEGAPAAAGAENDASGADKKDPAAPAAPGQSRPPGEPPKMDSHGDHLRTRVALEGRIDQLEKSLEQRFATERARSRADSLAYGAFQAEAAPVLAAAGKSILFTGDLVADRLAVAEQLLGADDNDVKAARAALKKRADSGEASGEATGLALGLYRTALAEHRRRHDSTGEQLSGLTHRADAAGDDDVLGALTSQYGGTAAKAKA